MNNRIIKILFIFILFQFISSCVSYTQILSTENKPRQDYSYIYGRYTLYYNGGGRRIDMGVVLEDTKKTNSYTIQFLPSDATSVIAVKPGTYNLTKVVFADGINSLSGQKPFSKGKLTEPFLVEAGKLYYLADFVGETSVSYSSMSWRLTSIKDNYNNTTAEFRNKFPNFKKLKTKRALE